MSGAIHWNSACVTAARNVLTHSMSKAATEAELSSRRPGSPCLDDVALLNLID